MNNIKPKERYERVYTTKFTIYQISNRTRDNIERAFLGDRIGAFNKKSDNFKLDEPDPRSDLYINGIKLFYRKRLRDSTKIFQCLNTIEGSI